MKSLSLLTKTWLVLAIATICQPAASDEGMWLFNDLPKDHLKKEYGFEPDDAWALIRLGFVSRRFPDYVPQTTSSISISLPERN